VCAFSTSKQATATTKIAVFVDGVAVTSGITKAVTGVTFATGPATTSDICIVYETA
jgi:hypothetical protein